MDMSPHTETTRTFEVWTVDRVTGQPGWRYRDAIPALAARNWAAAWNTKTPADVPDGTTFVVVEAVAVTTRRVYPY